MNFLIEDYSYSCDTSIICKYIHLKWIPFNNCDVTDTIGNEQNL
jgi:hypothetical protein